MRIKIESAGSQQHLTDTRVDKWWWEDVTHHHDGSDLEKLMTALYWSSEGQSIRISFIQEPEED